jgi:hypothetical protein
MIKIVFFLAAVLAAFSASTGLAFTSAPRVRHVSVNVPDAPVAAAPVAEPATAREASHGAIVASKPKAAKPAKRSTRVYRCETRALQMGTYGDTVQDCYWHDR